MKAAPLQSRSASSESIGRPKQDKENKSDHSDGYRSLVRSFPSSQGHWQTMTHQRWLMALATSAGRS